MTFSLNLEAKEIQLSAAWGQYVKEGANTCQREDRQPTAGVEAVSPWRQASADAQGGPIQPIVVDHNCPEVVVQGLVRKRSDHWCVTLFLVNEQQEPEKLKDTAWVFQPELMAEGVDGAAVIHKRHTILNSPAPTRQ